MCTLPVIGLGDQTFDLELELRSVPPGIMLINRDLFISTPDIHIKETGDKCSPSVIGVFCNLEHVLMPSGCY